MSRATAKAIRAWMLTLMGRQAPQTEQDALANVALSLPAFQARFSAEAFCVASIDAIAQTERFWNEAGVARALDTWCKINAPEDTHALPPEAESAPLDTPGKHWVANFLRAGSDAEAIRSLGLIRAKHREAFAWLLKTNDRAASIAVMHRWNPPSTTSEMVEEWDNEQEIRRRARKIAMDASARAWDRRGFNFRGKIMDVFVRIVKMHAPQHAWAMWEEWDALAHPVVIDVASVPASVPVAFPSPPAVEIGAGLFGD